MPHPRSGVGFLAFRFSQPKRDSLAPTQYSGASAGTWLPGDAGPSPQLRSQAAAVRRSDGFLDPASPNRRLALETGGQMQIAGVEGVRRSV